MRLRHRPPPLRPLTLRLPTVPAVAAFLAAAALTYGCVARSAGSPAEQQGVRNPAPDRIAALAGLTPLRDHVPPPGEREVRVWIGGGVGYPQDLYRIRERGDSAVGALIRYWPADVVGPDGRTSHEMAVAEERGRCEGFTAADGIGVCRATFTRRPDWEGLLRRAEERGLWSLPDPDSIALEPDESDEPEPEARDRVRRLGPLPPRGPGFQLDGWGMTVELRDGDHYRSYRYRFPLHSRRPEGERAGAIAMDFRETVLPLLGTAEPPGF